MKRFIKASDGGPVKLHVEYEPYDRYTQNPIKKANITAPTLREALAKMVDKMTLYLEPDEVMDVEEFPTENDIIERISESNGDGCDFIYLLKDSNDGFIYIDEGMDNEEEEW